MMEEVIILKGLHNSNLSFSVILISILNYFYLGFSFTTRFFSMELKMEMSAKVRLVFIFLKPMIPPSNLI